MVELYYDGAAPFDLSGMYLTNGAATPAKFVFPAGSNIAPGQYLVLYADANATTSGIHLGLALSGEGDGFTCTTVRRAGGLGRIRPATGGFVHRPSWVRGRVASDGPHLGRANLVQPLGDPGAVKINEWLVDGKWCSSARFIELYNPDAEPVDFGGTYLTDGPATLPVENRVGPLSFMAAHGYLVFQADNSDSPGHVISVCPPPEGRSGCSIPSQRRSTGSSTVLRRPMSPRAALPTGRARSSTSPYPRRGPPIRRGRRIVTTDLTTGRGAGGQTRSGPDRARSAMTGRAATRLMIRHGGLRRRSRRRGLRREPAISR